MRTRIIAAFAALAALLVGAVLVVTGGSASAASAADCATCHGAGFAPAAAPVQSDVLKVDGTTDANGVITVKLSGTLQNRPGDVVTLVTVTGPTGGAKNLPADVRVNGYVIDDNKTPADATDDTVGAVQLRVFGHQMVLDADGNYHLAVYRSLPFQADLKVTSGGIAYCAANACS